MAGTIIRQEGKCRVRHEGGDIKSRWWLRFKTEILDSGLCIFLDILRSRYIYSRLDLYFPQVIWHMLNRCLFGCHELCSFEFCVLHTHTNSAGWRCARCNLKNISLVSIEGEHGLPEQESLYMNRNFYVKLYQEKQLNSMSMRPEMSQQV